MKWYKPKNIVEPNDPVVNDNEYYNCVNPIRDIEQEENRVVGWVIKEDKKK